MKRETVRPVVNAAPDHPAERRSSALPPTATPRNGEQVPPENPDLQEGPPARTTEPAPSLEMVSTRERTRCEVCGNTYDKAFAIVLHNGRRHVFDCFECAFHALAPSCSHCGCRILGHGMESRAGEMYCGAHCAHARGAAELRDRS